MRVNDKNKEAALRIQAVQIALQLPSDRADAERVVKLAMEIKQWTTGGKRPPKRRAA